MNRYLCTAKKEVTIKDTGEVCDQLTLSIPPKMLSLTVKFPHGAVSLTADEIKSRNESDNPLFVKLEGLEIDKAWFDYTSKTINYTFRAAKAVAISATNHAPAKA